MGINVNLCVECQDPAALEEVQAEMLPLWKKFLLNQFHDVLPGSCIEQVHLSCKWSDHCLLYEHMTLLDIYLMQVAKDALAYYDGQLLSCVCYCYNIGSAINESRLLIVEPLLSDRKLLICY